MRINKYIASGSNLSRRAADAAIAAGRVTINGRVAKLGDHVAEGDIVRLMDDPRDLQPRAMQGAREKRSEPYKGYGERAAERATPQRAVSTDGLSGSAGKRGGTVHVSGLDNSVITPPVKTITIMLNKPVGYVCSRAGQGSQTIYDLLPPKYHSLNPVGRLDKNSSGLLLLTNDGALAHELTHPSRQKIKVYEVTLDQPLQPLHRQMISDHGVTLDDGPSKFELERLTESDDTQWKVIMTEGRNRQIRRTFAALGYEVIALHRTHFGPYTLGTLASGKTQAVEENP